MYVYLRSSKFNLAIFAISKYEFFDGFPLNDSINISVFHCFVLSILNSLILRRNLINKYFSVNSVLLLNIPMDFFVDFQFSSREIHRTL